MSDLTKCDYPRCGKAEPRCGTCDRQLSDKGSLQALLDKARSHVMTPEEIFEQKVSFIWGMQSMSSPGYSQEQIREMLIADGRGPSASPSLAPPERVAAALHACEGMDTSDLAGNDKGWLSEIVHGAARVESKLDYVLRACCAGNTEGDEPVRCQSYEASEQAEPCPKGRCVMAEPEPVSAIESPTAMVFKTPVVVEAMRLAVQFKGRADDAGYLSRALINIAMAISDGTAKV